MITRIRRRRMLAGGGSPPFEPTDADVAAYFAAAEGDGATYLNATKEALDTFVIGLKSASLWTLVRRMNPMLADGGDVLAGVANVLNDTVGAANADTLNNYVAGDWDPAAGLQGNGTSTYMDLGWIPTDAQVNLGWWGMKFTGAVLSGTRSLFSLIGPSGTDQLSLNITASQLRSRVGGTASPVFNSAVAPAILSTYRSSSTFVALLADNVLLDDDTTSTTAGSMGVENLPLGAQVQQGGTYNQFLSADIRIAGYLFMDALDSTQRDDLQTLWAAFNTAIGR